MCILLQGSFCKYLSCVQHIAAILGDDASAHRGVIYQCSTNILVLLYTDLLVLNSSGAKSVLVMARKCLERAEDIFIDIIDNKKTLPEDKPPQLPPKNGSAVVMAPPPVSLAEGVGKLSNSCGAHSPLVRYVIYHSVHNGIVISPRRLHSLSPMEEAKIKNQKLMSMYQEHLRKRASSLLPQDCNRLVSLECGLVSQCILF